MQTRSREGRSGSDQATVGRTTSPLRGTPCGSLFSTPSAKGERGLPTRHSLRERRLPLDVQSKETLQPSNWHSALGITFPVGIHWPRKTSPCIPATWIQSSGPSLAKNHIDAKRDTRPRRHPTVGAIGVSSLQSHWHFLLISLAPMALGRLLQSQSLAGSIYTSNLTGWISSNALSSSNRPRLLAKPVSTCKLMPDDGSSAKASAQNLCMQWRRSHEHPVSAWPWYFMLLFLVHWGQWAAEIRVGRSTKPAALVGRKPRVGSLQELCLRTACRRSQAVSFGCKSPAMFARHVLHPSSARTTWNLA